MHPHNTTQISQPELPFPKFCECGCGAALPIPQYPSQQRHFVHGHGTRRSAEKRFWEKVDRRGPDDCWLWTGGHKSDGYGTFWDGITMVSAHRFSYALCHSSCPPDLNICHRCSVPGCVNPAHLYAGTQQDNMRDMAAIGRAGKSKGERHWCAKVTPELVREIRSRYARGEKQTALAEELGISASAVGHITRRESWMHIP